MKEIQALALVRKSDLMYVATQKVKRCAIPEPYELKLCGLHGFWANGETRRRCLSLERL